MGVRASQFTFDLGLLGLDANLALLNETCILEVKHGGRVLTRPLAERGSRISEEKREGRVLTLSAAERDSRVLELKCDGCVLARL